MKYSLLLFTYLFWLPFFAQQEDAWFFLKDKPQHAIFLANPLTMLSQRALNRRTTQSISLDEKDVPIDNVYSNQHAK